MQRNLPQSLRKIAVSGVLSALAVTTSAQADDVSDARVLYQKAGAAYRSDDDVMAREYYRQSWELHESFDTVCNWGRAEVRSKLFEDAYEHLRLCVFMYPQDEELASARQGFLALRDEARKELTFEEAQPIDERVDADIARRERNALPLPPSGLEGLVEEPASAPEPEPVKRNWTPAWIMGGVTVATLGTSMIFRGLAGGKAGDVEDLSSGGAGDCVSGNSAECQRLDDLANSHDTLATVSNVTLVAGGVAAAATLGYITYVLLKKPAVAGGVTATAGFDSTGGTILLSGHF